MSAPGFLVLTLLCAQSEPSARPQGALDPEDPRSVVEHAVYNTRRQQSYATRFTARMSAPLGDPIDYRGVCLWVAPGVLYIHYTASGGDEKNIVRVGDQVWVYHEAAGWVTAEEIGSPGLARGIQNPDEILAAVGKHLGRPRLRPGGVLQATFRGEELEGIMKDQAKKGAFEWKESRADVELHVDGEIRLKKFACQAELKPMDPQVKGRVSYTAEVEVESYNDRSEMKFHDDKKEEIPLVEEIRKAIGIRLQGGK